MEGSTDAPSVQVQNIIDKIMDDAQKKAKEIEDKAKEEKNSVLADAKEKGEKTKAEIIANGEKKAKAEKDRIIADARVRARKVTLKARERVIEEAFAKATKEIGKATATKGYQETLKRLIQESISIVGKGSIELVLTSRDKKQLKAEDLEGMKDVSISSDELPSMGGVIVRKVDGSVEIDNTIETRIQRGKSDLRRKAAEILFDEGG
ncbi:MAG: V-type ATP synthase subunit E [Candidatus Hydrothermarchaeales archaeon]